MNRRTTVAIAAVLGLIALSLGASSITSNATEPARSPLKTAPLAPPPPMAQMNEAQQLRMQVQRLEAQVSQLSGDVAALRARYNAHTHQIMGVSLSGMKYTSNGYTLLSGGEGAWVLTTDRAGYRITAPQ